MGFFRPLRLAIEQTGCCLKAGLAYVALVGKADPLTAEGVAVIGQLKGEES